MKKLIVFVSVLFFFLSSVSAFSQDFDEILRDAEETVRDVERVLNTGDRLKKKFIGETAEIDVTNGFPTSTNFFVEATANSNRSKGDTVLSLYTSESGVIQVPVFSDEGTNVNVVIKVYRLMEDEKEFLFSYQKEFFMNMGFRSTSHTVNESTSRSFQGNGSTKVLFVNYNENLASVTYFTREKKSVLVLEANESKTVDFSNDEAPFANILIEVWGEDDKGQPIVIKSETKKIVFSNYLFTPYEIK